MKYFNQAKRYAGGLAAKARENMAYILPAGAGIVGGLLIVPQRASNGWSLFSFSMSEAMTQMMTMAESIFNSMVQAYGNIWGIALGFGILAMVSAAIFAVVKIRQSR